MKGVACPFVSRCLNMKGSLSSTVAPPREDVGMIVERRGLRVRHSSSKVTERLDRTVLVEGKYTIHD